MPRTRVAAGPRHDVHRGAADLGFAEAARRREGDLLRVADVRQIPGHAAAAQRRADRQPVHLQATLGASSAWAAEHRRGPAAPCTSREPPVTAGISWKSAPYERDVGSVGDDLAAHRRLPADALHVDDGRFAGDGDGLLERADAHLGVRPWRRTCR